MKTYPINYYLDTYSTLCPTDLEVGIVASTEWWTELKGLFDDIIWLYFPDRVLFINERFSSDNESQNYNNIKKTFAIWLKSKKRLIDRLYNGYMADFNPLWNVDGVTGVIIEDSHTGKDTDVHSGNDKTSYEDNGNVTRSGNEVNAITGTDVTEDGSTTFDSGGVYKPMDKSGLTHGRTDTHTYNNVKDQKDYDGYSDLVYNSQLEKNKNTKDTHLEMQIRQGNIGVTQSDKILKDSQMLYMDELMDLWKYIIRMCVNQVSYAVEGV